MTMTLKDVALTLQIVKRKHARYYGREEKENKNKPYRIREKQVVECRKTKSDGEKRE